MRLRELLDTKPEGEVVLREERDGILPDGGLAAARRSGDEHNLGALQRAEYLLHERRTLQMKVRADGGADGPKRDGGVIFERLQHTLLIRADWGVSLLQHCR